MSDNSDPSNSSPAAVARGYFDAVQAASRAQLRALLADDAELVSINAGFTKGAEAIADYYEENFFAAGARLRPKTGPLIVHDDIVAVEVQARSENGNVSWLSDFFTVRDGLIQRLHVYYGPVLEGD